MAYTDMTGEFAYKDPLLWKQLQALAENDEFLKENGWQNGDKTVFFQAAAPTGWTKDTTAALDGKILRVVSGSGAATGGTTAIASGITLAHTHSISSQGNHTHSVAHSHDADTSAITDGSGLGATAYNGAVAFTTTGGSPGSGRIPKTDYTDDDSQTSSSAGSHDHGGTTGSALSNITLAYIDVVICSKDSSSGYVDVTDVFSYGVDLGEDDIFETFNDMGGNDEFNLDRLIPAGAVSVFGQATTPTGWTKLTAQDDKALRVVTGTGGGSGGSHGFGTEIDLAHSAHSITAGGSHSHTLSSHDHNLGSLAGESANIGDIHFRFESGAFTGYSGGGVASRQRTKTIYDSVTASMDTDPDHQHTLQSSLSNVTLANFSVVYGSKDSTPNDYDDMSAFFADGNLLAWQDLDQLATNDDHIKYHQLPVASVMFFYMASAPSGWTKTTDQNDKGLRVVSGTGGSAAGSQAISSAITLAHTHSIDAYAHEHDVQSHLHTMTTDFVDQFNSAIGARVVTGGVNGRLHVTGSGSTAMNVLSNTAEDINAQDVVDDSHTHGGATGSGLSNVTLAYADVIKCTKD